MQVAGRMFSGWRGEPNAKHISQEDNASWLMCWSACSIAE
jgi:hypothetical protein